MSFRRLVVAITFLAVFTMAVRVSTDTDTWWHLRAGAWMIERGEVLRIDPFSLTRMGQPWIYPGWLAQLLLYGVYSALGFAGLNLLTAVMVVTAFAAIWPLLEGPPLLRAFVTLLAATASGVYWAARPHILSFVLTGAFLLCLERARSGDRRWLIALPALMLLWVNVHGGFAIGFLLLGVYALGEALELLVDAPPVGESRQAFLLRARESLMPLGAALASCLVAVAVNPNGPVMLLYPFKTVSIGVLQQYIEEWRSPDFHRLETQPFLWLLLLTTVALAFSRRRPSAVELLGLIGFGYMAFLAGRNIALFSLVAAPVLSRHSDDALRRLPFVARESRPLPDSLTWRINLLLLVLLVLGAAVKISVPLSPEANEAALQERFPVEAAAYLDRERPPGELFNSYNWGGYVLWRLYPEYPSFVDGRTDLFEDEILTEYLQAWRGEEGWQETFRRWNVRVVLLEPEAPLVRELKLQGWVEGYVDDVGVVLLGSSAAGKD